MSKIKAFEERWVTEWQDWRGWVRRMFIVDEDGEEREFVVEVKELFIPKEDVEDEEPNRRFKVEGDTVIVPTITVIIDGAVDFEESDPSFTALGKIASQVYPELPSKVFEF